MLIMLYKEASQGLPRDFKIDLKKQAIPRVGEYLTLPLSKTASETTIYITNIVHVWGDSPHVKIHYKVTHS